MVPGPGLSRGYIRAVSLNFCHLEPENPLPNGLTWWFVALGTSGTVGGDPSSLSHGVHMGCRSVLKTCKLTSPGTNDQKEGKEPQTEAAVFCTLISERTYHPSCRVLLVKQTNLAQCKRRPRTVWISGCGSPGGPSWEPDFIITFFPLIYICRIL